MSTTRHNSPLADQRCQQVTAAGTLAGSALIDNSARTDAPTSMPCWLAWRRVLFASLFALVACGMSFYVMLCLGIMANLARRGWNPANSLALQFALRRVAVPASLLVAGVVFVFTVRRPVEGRESHRGPIS